MTHDARNAASNFTPLRLALAVMVVLGHFRLISGSGWPLWYLATPRVAVDCFFVVSGFLIAASYDRDPNLLRYAIRRIMRIYPLYATVILLQVIILAALSQHGSSVHAQEVLRYIVANLAFANFIQRDLGNGALSGMHDPSLNPSLWTLKIELGFYVVLPLIWTAAKRYGWTVLVAVFFGSALYQWVLMDAGHVEFAKQLPGQLQYFVLGIAGYRLRGKPALHPWIAYALVAAVGLLVFYLHPDRIPIVYPIELGILVVLLATRLPPLAMRNDISYGIYLLHGPVIQLSLLLGVYHPNLLVLGTVLLVVVLLALVAERLVETPGIAFGRWLAARVGHRISRNVEHMSLRGEIPGPSRPT